jgi:hypothetical protein
VNIYGDSSGNYQFSKCFKNLDKIYEQLKNEVKPISKMISSFELDLGETLDVGSGVFKETQIETFLLKINPNFENSSNSQSYFDLLPNIIVIQIFKFFQLKELSRLRRKFFYFKKKKKI